MKGIVKGLALAGLGLAFAANTAHAQKPGPEFGIQFVGVSSTSPDGGDAITTIGLGNSDISVAFYMNEMIAIEPTLTFSRVSSGDVSASALGLQVAVPIYLKKDWGKGGGLFIAPHAGINRLSADDGVTSGSGSQLHFGANLGTKIRVSDNIFWRAQAGIDLGQESTGGDITFGSYTMFGGSFGITAYWP